MALRIFIIATVGHHTMIMIHTHLIASHSPTTIYTEASEQSPPVTEVAEGSWLGVVESVGAWIKVISIDCEGWVKRSDTESVPPMGLHAVWRPGKPIEYRRLSNAS
ncbi:MAG TPA: hypothetical protein VFV79_02315 [Saprospiraceae bacterium]|nr:hypothetical protein [Saprospiraceae bacterium]